MNAYPPDFKSWSEARRNRYFADEAKRFHEAKTAGNGQADAEAVKFAELEPTFTGDPQFTEDRLALDFASTHANELRYVAAWGKWLAWTGTYWEFENTLAVFDLARKICRAAAARCNKPSISSALAKAKTVAAVEMLSRSDRRIAATKDQWDASHCELNMKGSDHAR